MIIYLFFPRDQYERAPLETEDHVDKGVPQVPEAEMVLMVPWALLVPLAPLVLPAPLPPLVLLGTLLLSILTKEFHLALDQWV